jgi:hypothetical protein
LRHGRGGALRRSSGGWRVDPAVKWALGGVPGLDEIRAAGDAAGQVRDLDSKHAGRVIEIEEGAEGDALAAVR